MSRSAGLDGVVLHSEGHRLVGAFHRAAGEGRRPAVLLLHGLPGHEQNIDLAVDLRDRGIHSLRFHYRGCWGSEGDYSLRHVVPDSHVALEWLASHPLVDPTRLALVGISLGGWAALMLAAEVEGVRAVVALSPLIDPLALPDQPSLLAEFAESLHGSSPERLTAESRELPFVLTVANRLASLPILVVTAGADEIFPPAHYLGLRSRLPHIAWESFPRADHVYSDVRPGLRHLVCRWLIDRFQLAG